MSTCQAPESVPVAEQERGEQEQKGRDGRGRFLPGNAGGPGNPFGRQVAELRKAMLGAISKEVIAELTQKAIDMARTGDAAAMKLVFQYGLGRPAEPVNPDRVDVEEWRLAVERAVPVPVWRELMQHLPVEEVNPLNSIFWACQAEKFINFMKEGMAARRPGAGTATAAGDDGETDRPMDADKSTTAPADPESVSGGNGQRHRAAAGARAHRVTNGKRSSSSTGNHGKHGAPSPAAGNGDRARRPRHRAGGDGWPTEIDVDHDDARPSFANLLAGLPPEALEALDRG